MTEDEEFEFRHRLEQEQAGGGTPAPYSSVPTLNSGTGEVTRQPLPGQAPPAAKPTLTQQITALVETGMHLASAATGGVLGAIGGAAGAFAGSASQGGLQIQRDAQGRASVPALDAIGEGAKEGAQRLTYVPRSGLGLERSEQATRGLSELAPLAGLPGEVAALSSGARLAGRDLRTAGSAALDANREFNTARTLATEAKAAKQAELKAADTARKMGRAGTAVDAGIPVAPHQLSGNRFLKYLGETLEHVPGSRGATNREARIANYSAGLAKAIDPESKATKLDDAAFKDLQDKAGAEIGDIAGRTNVPVKSFGDVRDVARRDTPDVQQVVDTYAKDLQTLADQNGGSVPGTALRKLRTEVQAQGRAARAGKGDLANALDRLANRLDDALSEHAPEGDMPKLLEARRRYAISKTLEPLLAKHPDGNFPPQALMSIIGRKTGGGERRMARGEGGDLGDYAEMGAKLLREQATSGTGERNLIYRLASDAATAAKTATVYPVALAYNVFGPKIVKRMVEASRKKKAPPPEPPLTAEQSPFPPQGGPEGPASPLGDLTPDWETAPGAAAPAGRTEVVPAEGLVPAVDEAPGPSRVLPGGADLRPRSAESPAGPVQPGPVAEPPTPSRRAGEQIPAVPGRPDLPDTLAAEGPAGITPSAPGDPRAPDASYANRVQQGLEKPGGFADEPIPVGEATEMLPADPRLAELEQLRESAKSETVKKALAAEAAKLKRELKAQAEAEKLKADAAELRQAAGNVKDPKLKERLLARADDLEKTEKLPVGEVTEGQPEIKPEKVGKIPVGKATEIPNGPATGRAPEMEKLPVGEAKQITDSGVEEAIPTGEAKELFTPPEKGQAKVPEAEVRLEKGPRGQLEGFDKKGDPYQVKVSEQMLGADKKEKSILVEVHDPVTGQRRGFVDFAIRKDGTLVAENVKVAPYLKKRGLAELMYRAARDAKYDIAPGRVQTEEGLAMVEALQRKGIINKEAEGPRAKASDLKEKQDVAGQVKQPEGVQQERVQGDEGRKTAEAGGGNRVQRATGGEEKGLPEGVTLRPVKSGGYEALNKQGNRIGHITKTGEVFVDKAFAGKGIVQALRDAAKKPKP